MTDRLRVSMPPDPNPRKPAFKAPPGACDTHCHIFGPPELFPYAASRAYTPPAAPVEHYLDMLDAIGVERGIIVQPNAHATDNAVTLDAVARGGARLRGMCRLTGSETMAEMRRLHAGGVRAARFNFAESLFGRAPNLAPVEQSLPKMQELGWCIDVHADAEGLVKYADTFRKFPVPVVIDHLGHVHSKDAGGRPFRLLLDLLAEPKFWVKIAGIDWLSAQGRPYDDVAPMARAALEAAPDRVLWGTNWPHSMRFKPGMTPNDGDLIDFVPRFAPEPELQRKLLVDNPARLFGFAA